MRKPFIILLLNAGMLFAIGRDISFCPGFSPAVPFAVEFLGLSISREGPYVALTWSTATETENQGFIIERKTDSLLVWELYDNYLNNDALLGQGTVSLLTEYCYCDSQVTDGHHYYYRLSGVDAANNIGLLDSVSIFMGETAAGGGDLPAHVSLQVYPNPFNAHASIRFSSGEDLKNISLRLFDVSGRHSARLSRYAEISRGDHLFHLHAGSLPGGIYIFSLFAETAQGTFLHLTKKLLVLK